MLTSLACVRISIFVYDFVRDRSQYWSSYDINSCIYTEDQGNILIGDVQLEREKNCEHDAT